MLGLGNLTFIPLRLGSGFATVSKKKFVLPCSIFSLSFLNKEQLVIKIITKII